MYQQTISNPLPIPPQDAARLAEALAALARGHDSGSLPFLTLPEAREDIAAMRPVVEKIINKFNEVVVLGTGGSSLGAQALCALKGPQAARDEKQIRLHFLDNLGPHSMAAHLHQLNLARSHFIVVSKSGGTAETMAQLIAAFAALREVVDTGKLAEHFTVIVEPGSNPLRRFAESRRLPTFDHDPNLGGRFSVFSLVGVLPAMAAGLDVTAFRDGAAETLRLMRQAPNPNDVAAAVAADVIVALHAAHGVNINVMMPYDCRLERFAAWHQQLWAESLGKDGHGTTPVRALGPVDQHSQLQLYLDGPADKFFTVITSDQRGEGPLLASDLADDPDLAYLRGHTIGDVVTAEAAATVTVFKERGRPLRHLRLRQVNERSLGALMMHFMLETIIASHLYGVNPYDQPAVELGKRLTKEYLRSKSGLPSFS